MATETGSVPVAIVPVDVKAPVVALIVYMETLPADPACLIRHIGELAGWIHGYRDCRAFLRQSSLLMLRPRSWR